MPGVPCHWAAVAVLSAMALGRAWGQGGIYTCVDAKGRRLTSDRPIVECLDRPQKELSATGSVRRILPPSLTAEERAAAEEEAKKAQEDKLRQDEEKRRARALLNRYPDKAAHDKERTAALRQVDEVIAAGQRRAVELQHDQKKLATEAEFYRSDPAKMPPKLRKQIEENQHQIAGQQRFIVAQEEEKTRVNARFDEELGRLRALWAEKPVAARARSPASSAAAR